MSSAETAIRLLVVDDHEIVRAGVRALLARTNGIEVIADVASTDAAIPAAVANQPNVVLMGVRLPDGSAVEACREILALCPQTRVVLLTSHHDEDAVLAAVTAGVHGIVLKDIGGDSLVRTIHGVAEGQSILCPTAAMALIDRMRSSSTTELARNKERLSRQEQQVLALVAQGRTNKQIASAMSISDKTVKNYLSNVFQKLRVTRRAEAAARFANGAR